MIRIQGHKLFPLVMCSQGSTLYLFDGATHAVWKVEVTVSSSIPSGQPSLVFNFANSVSSIANHGSAIHIASPSIHGGLYRYDIDTKQLQRVVGNDDKVTVTVVSSNDHHTVFTDSSSSQLFSLLPDNSTTPRSGVARTGKTFTSKDGFSSSCSHAQPTVVCLEEKSVFVCDLASLSIRIVTDLKPLLRYHSFITKVFQAFAVHSHSSGFCTPLSAPNTIQNLQEACQIYQCMLAGVRKLCGNNELKPNGPNGSLPFITIEMFDELLNGTRNLLTIPCEHHFSAMRSRYQMPTLLQYCDLLTTVIEKATVTAYLYFTHKDSYYPQDDFRMNKRVPNGRHSSPVPRLDGKHRKPMLNWRKDYCAGNHVYYTSSKYCT